MFGKFGGKKKCVLFSPAKGRMIPIEKVKDKVFAEKVMGDGVAFIFEGDTLYAPCGGKVIMASDIGHAVGVRTKERIEILLHVGYGAAFVKRGGFNMLTSEGKKIEAHEPLIRINWQFLREQGMDLTTSLVVTKPKNYQLKKSSAEYVSTDDIVMELVENR